MHEAMLVTSSHYIKLLVISQKNSSNADITMFVVYFGPSGLAFYVKIDIKHEL